MVLSSISGQSDIRQKDYRCFRLRLLFGQAGLISNFRSAIFQFGECAMLIRPLVTSLSA